MTPKKIGKHPRKPIRKVREMTFTDSGPWASGEKGVLQRIAYALRVWCEENAVAPSSASIALAVGWRGGRPPSDATVDNLAGQAYSKTPQSRRGLPNTRTLWALCDRIGVSAEWILTGVGPKLRRTVAEGGRLSLEDFARELAAHVVTACSDIYGIDVPLYCDSNRLLNTVITFVRTEARADMASFGVRKIEIMEHMRVMSTAAKAVKLIEGDHPHYLSIALELKERFLSLQEQILLPVRASRLPIIQEQFRQEMIEGEKLLKR